MKQLTALVMLFLSLCSCACAASPDHNPLDHIYDNDDLVADVQLLCDLYPELISVHEIGETVEGRTIHCVCIGRGTTEVLILSGIHATEIANPAMVMRTLWDLAEARPTPAFLEEVTLVVVPCANPDGFARSLRARKKGLHPVKKGNANDVNLNRNFPSALWTVFGRQGNLNWSGEVAGSEPETQAIMHLIDTHHFAAGLDIHSQGRLVYYGKPAFRQYDLQTTAKVSDLITRTKELAEIICPRAYTLTFDGADSRTGGYGTSTDYMYTMGIPCVCLETMPDGNYSPDFIRDEYALLDLPSLFEQLAVFAIKYQS